MDEEELAKGLKQSVNKEIITVISPLLDAEISCLTQNDLISRVPLISTVVGLYHLGTSFKDYYTYKKLLKFIDRINSKDVTQEEIDNHLSKYNHNNQRELEYIIVMIDRLQEIDQSDLLGKLYVSYIRGTINWLEFRQYANVIDRLLPGDIEKLYDFHSKEPIELDTKVIDSSILRLQGIGLINNYNDIMNLDGETLKIGDSNKAYYKETAFANKFVECIK